MKKKLDFIPQVIVKLKQMTQEHITAEQANQKLR